ncbi:MAG: hypoxanthine phosphoribosyltransferase [Acholeplasmatales bacterium]|nr:hypoxanthine phosphoribosyltransferase [Acholeplasmatales bacterium]
MNEDIKRVIFNEKDIEKIIDKLAKEINNDYKGQSPVAIGLLKGCLPFMSDLVKKFDFDVKIEYMRTSSYVGTESRDVKIIGHVPDVKDMDVLLIDDIIDSGKTLKEIQKLLLNMGAKSVRTCVLLDKILPRKIELNVDYVGSRVENEFVVGYGFDYNESYRNLPFIGVLREEVYKK